MPSTTRGSILISTANDIGEALVDKLGGVGYSPNEWKEKYNLCGIAPVDSAPALSVLADSAGTGDARGSILIATADAIGAILNKKYNVLRGFKPKEWASACRKMKALEEGSVASASIASFSDGADTVPLTSCVCSIDANLDGKSAVNAVHAGVNLLANNIEDGTTGSITYTKNNDGSISCSGTVSNVNSTRLISTQVLPIGNYLLSGADSSINLRCTIYDSNGSVISNRNDTGSGVTVTIDSTVAYVEFRIKARTNAEEVNTTIFPMFELGSTASTFEAYKGETKTADLGRAVYGGSADIIKGEGVETYTNTSLSDKNYYYSSSLQRFDCALDGVVSSGYMDDFIPPQGYTINHALIVDGANAPDYTMCIYGGKLYIKNLSCSNVSELVVDMNGKYIVYQLETPVDFTFEPVKIDSFDGVNNIWNDCGNTAVEYYQAPTPYTRKTATGGVANFSDQRTDLPLTKAIANIAPSIAGKSAVNLVMAGKNLADGNMYQDGSNRVILIENIFLKATNYTISLVVTMPKNFYYRKHGETWTNLGGYNKTVVSFSISEATYYDFSYYVSTGVSLDEISDLQLEVGSTASTFEPYQAPTTYTAELCETVYGGSVDFVSGEKSVEYGMITFDGSSDESWLYSDAYGWFYIDNQFGDAYRNNSESDFMICNLGTQSPYVSVTSLADLHFACTSGTNSRFAFKNSQYSTVEDFKTWLSNNNMIVVYKLATPTESAIPGRVISPIEGVNNYWNDAGGDTEIQYFENEA